MISSGAFVCNILCYNLIRKSRPVSKPFGISFFCKLSLLTLVGIFLIQPPVFPGQSVRIVNLKIVADEEFRSAGDWRLEISRRVSNASRVFEQNFGIRFEIGIVESWSSDNSQNSVIDLLNNLRKRVSLEEYDAVLGFTDQPRMDYGMGGVASYLKDLPR